jgi:uncharacterized membrane protein
MPSARLPRNVFFVVVLAALARCSYFYPLLPERMASHFDRSGVPNGWMTKPLFFELYAAGVALGIVVVFLPALTVARLPAYLINLPNKEYWLAPEHRAETNAFLKRSFAWFGCAFLAVQVVGLDLAMQANLVSPPRVSSESMFVCLAVFLIWTVWWTIDLIRHFSVPKSSI